MNTRPHLPVIFILMSCLGASSAAPAADGAARYAHDCATCHGARGAGDGEQGRKLDPRPADLRALAARNGGQFPTEKVRRIIDGRDQGRAHGDGAMPVWGYEYRRALAGEGERMVQDNVDALVAYLQSLQQSGGGK